MRRFEELCFTIKFMTENENKMLPIYLLVGDDEQKKETLTAKMKERCASFGEMSINTDVFDGEDHDPGNIVSSCLTLPFASEKRLIIVNHVEIFTTAELNVLADYAEKPNDSTILFLVAEKLAKNTRLYKAIAKVDAKSIIACDSPKSWEFKNYAIKVAKSKGVAMRDDAAQLLVDLTGPDTVAITNELEKIIASHSSNDAIDAEEVESLVAATANVKPWVLVDAFSAKNVAKVMELLPKVQGTTPTGILVMCVNRVRELICAKEMAAKGGNVASNIAVELGFAPALSWRVKNHEAWARQWTGGALVKSLRTSVEAEKQMKTGEDQTQVLKLWLAEAMNF